MNSVLTGIFMSLSVFLAQQKALKQEYQEDKVLFLREYLEVKYPDDSFPVFLYVAVKKQRLYLIDSARVVREYTISTALEGIGSVAGSLKTPGGLHRIRELIGDTVPLNGIIRQKVYTGQIADIELRPIQTHLDLITTRAIHLSGVEQGVNCGGRLDSYSRGIFIHGTNEEGLLGQPVSRGCIRMANTDIAELYPLLKPEMAVVILNN